MTIGGETERVVTQKIVSDECEHDVRGILISNVVSLSLQQDQRRRRTDFVHPSPCAGLEPTQWSTGHPYRTSLFRRYRHQRAGTRQLEEDGSGLGVCGRSLQRGRSCSKRQRQQVSTAWISILASRARNPRHDHRCRRIHWRHRQDSWSQRGQRSSHSSMRTPRSCGDCYRSNNFSNSKAMLASAIPNSLRQLNVASSKLTKTQTPEEDMSTCPCQVFVDTKVVFPADCAARVCSKSCQHV